MCVIASALGGQAVEQSAATRRLKLLQRLVTEQAAKAGFERNLTSARKAVMDAFQKAEPDCPMWPDEAAVPDSRCTEEATKLTDRIIGETIAPLNVTELESEAAEAFPIYEVGQVIEVPFRSNPVRVVTARGPYRGKRPESLIVGPHKVPIKDVAFRNREAELLKFEPEKSKLLRQEYVEAKKQEYEQARKTAWDRAYQIALLGERKLATILNSKSGYILYNGTWDRARSVVSRMLEDERDRIQAEKRKAELAKREAQRKLEEARQKALEEAEAKAKAEAEEAKAEAEKAKAEAEEAKAGAAAEETKKEDAAAETATETVATDADTAKEQAPDDLTAVAEPGEDAAAEEGEQPTAEPADQSDTGGTAEPAQEGEAPAPDDQDPGSAQGMAPSPADAVQPAPTEESGKRSILALPPAALYGGIAAVGLVAAVLVLLLWMKQRPRGRFHTLRVDAERDFWGPAEANPVCRYVAYWYAEEGDARSALAHLSFIEDRGFSKPMVCTPDIDFGVYREVENEKERYISFVGGPALTHMLWREAKVRLGRHEEAREYKISDPPERRAVVPDPATVGGKAQGVELVHEGDGDGDDFAYYYHLRAPSKESAQAYLKKVAVGEPGLFVVVETPEGHWGRDMRGTYRE